jgi:protein-tyrosine-phosphatase/DNA-binding transcriptional ArsR family regulator
VGATTGVGDASPPSFLRLAGHPLRWRVLRELARSDHQVRELCDLLDQPQNLVSYHLSRLRRERLVTMRRSSADGREVYYSLDLARCGELLSATGGALHPALRLGPRTPRARARGARRARPQVLFLCTGNSARSQMAQALLESHSGGAVQGFSAGSHPKPLQANAVRAMLEHGIDISGRRSRHVDDFTGRRFAYVISLCDKVREVCPEFPGAAVVHWSIADPARTGDSDDETYPAFQRTASELAARVGFLLARIEHAPTTQEVE